MIFQPPRHWGAAASVLLVRGDPRKGEIMTEHIIVSRHPAAIAFIRATAPEFAAAPVVESATPDAVRGKVVAGNLPLALAALATEVVAVEFAGAPPRGQEYGLEEMHTAGARLTRYVILAAADADSLRRKADSAVTLMSSEEWYAEKHPQSGK